MKILAIIGTLIGIAAITAALYLQFVVAEDAAIGKSNYMGFRPNAQRNYV